MVYTGINLKVKQFNVVIESYGDYSGKDIQYQIQTLLDFSGISGFRIIKVEQQKNEAKIE